MSERATTRSEEPAPNGQAQEASSATSGGCGRLLRERRNEMGLSLTNLARTVEISKSQLSMIEGGQRLPTDDQFESLSRALEIPSDVLRVAAGRLPPDVVSALPDRADTIVTAIRRESSAAKVSLPCSLSQSFRALINSKKDLAPRNDIEPFREDVRAGKNSQAYRAHSYHTKVPPEAIDRLVRHYTDPGHVVADPFCGSGMTGVGSILAERFAVLSDLSPAAVHIARNYTTPCDPASFLGAAARLMERARPTLTWLYETGTASSRSRVEYTVWSDVFRCRHCSSDILYWDGGRDARTGAVADVITCPTCKHGSSKRDLVWIGEKPVETNALTGGRREAHSPTGSELELIDRANLTEVLYWIPQVAFTSGREMWRASHTALGVDSVAAFYTRRNLHALAAIRHHIQEEKDERLRSALMFAFTGMVNRASKRYQWNVKRPTNVMTGTLYISSLRYEWNVGSLFERKLRDVAKYFQHLGTPTTKADVVHSSATHLEHLDDASVDYVFMDPPFGSNIFYADSGLLWDAWLGALTDEREEIVVNRSRTAAEGGKTLSDYQRLMARSFGEVRRILKPGACATLQFNNSSDDVWRAIQDAVSDAGLEVRHAVGLDKIHPSIKGVKGLQAKEDIASFDALIELRQKAQPRRAASVAAPLAVDVEKVFLDFVASRRAPFTTDEAFSALIRGGLTSGHSLVGLSIQTVKALCEKYCSRLDDRWVKETPSSRLADLPYEPVGSPTGCVVDGYISPSSSVHQLVRMDRPAPNASGDPPRVVVGQRNTALYNAHSYHTKLPPEAITPFIKHFTRRGDVVLDPFCGTGMTGVAASQAGRRAILNDLSVAAAHLSYNHTRPCDPRELQAEFDKVAADLNDEFREIYACSDRGKVGYLLYTLWGRDAICPSCKKAFSIWDAIDRESGRMPLLVTCPRCGAGTAKQGLKYAGSKPVLLSYETASGQRVERAPNAADLKLIAEQSAIAPRDWYPDVHIDPSREMYIRSALHLQGIKTVSDFYMPRNLRALSRLWARIQQVTDDRLRAGLAFAFTNTAWHGTRMRRFNARGGQRPLTGTLYVPQLSSEANVLEVMRNKMRQLRTYYSSLGAPSEPLPAIRVGSATNLQSIPDASIDYVFTDPPFGSNLFYADCNLVWESWLGGLTRESDEAVVNRSRDARRGGKSVDDYELLMTESLREVHRVLKPKAWATLVFHNTDPAVWRAIQNAAEAAGFKIDDAGALDRKQQSHKGYKGRSESEDVAHFDVIMSMRKRLISRTRKSTAHDALSVQDLVKSVWSALPPDARTIQRVHSEVIQALARAGRKLDEVSFEDVRVHVPDAPTKRSAPSTAPRKRKS